MSKGIAFDFFDPAKIDARREQPLTAAAPAHKPMEFTCDECGRPGMYGEGVSLLRGVMGTWFCAKHAPVYLKHPAKHSSTQEQQHDDR